MIAHEGSLRKIDSSTETLSMNSPAQSKKYMKPVTAVTSISCSTDTTLYAISVSIPTPEVASTTTTTNLSPCDTSSQPQHVHACHTYQQQLECSILFSQEQFDFMSRLFCILDTENQGFINCKTLFDFLILRCPLFSKRQQQYRRRRHIHPPTSYTFPRADETTTHVNESTIIPIASEDSTFNDIWTLTILSCSKTRITTADASSTTKTIIHASAIHVGLEGFMIFCRFIQIVQYYELKRTFSHRHVQQTMQHKKDGTGSEVILIQIPPLDPPTPLTYDSLLELDWNELPTLDMDFSFQDEITTCCSLYNYKEVENDDDNNGAEQSHNDDVPIRPEFYQGIVHISEFRPCFYPSTNNTPWNSITSSSRRSNMSRSSFHYRNKTQFNQDLDFVLSFEPHSATFSSFNSTTALCHNYHHTYSKTNTKVKRSLNDFIWLHELFLSYKIPGDVLWGRIIPPFPIDVDPSSSIVHDDDSSIVKSSSHRTHSYTSSKISNTTSETGLLSVATSGMNMFKSIAKTAAKSFFGLESKYKSNANPIYTTSTTNNTNKYPRNTSTSSWLSSSTNKYQHYAWREESYLPVAFERYINYILECPMLSLSFPVHALLRTSGAGLECAKQFIQDQRDELKSRILSQVHDHGISSSTQRPKASHSTKRARKSWIRSAAQAAVSIHMHAILESTGHSTASVKLQHASMPYIASSKGRQDEDNNFPGQVPTNGNRIANLVSEFERGVISVESELDVDEWGDLIQMSGYDLLPSPLPPSERSALCAGKAIRPSTLAIQDDGGFLYGEFECSKNPDDSSLSCPPTLGDVSLDSDIDRLRDIMYGLKHDLETCLVSIVACDDANRIRADLHLRILTMLDNWEGMRGLIVSQKALLQGVASFNTSMERYVTSTERIIQDVSWQVSLASSAITAANEVRCTFQASQTAISAKEAADLAYQLAVHSLDTKTENEDSEVVQAKICSLKQQVMHSAIIEYEALSAKNYSSAALAHDVRTWNIHRKRQVFNACSDIVSSQQKCARQLTEAWEQFRAGLINHSPVMDVSTSLCMLKTNAFSCPSKVSSSLTNVNSLLEHELIANKSEMKCDFYSEELMLVDKNSVFMDTFDPSSQNDDLMKAQTISYGALFLENDVSSSNDDIGSSKSIVIAMPLAIDNPAISMGYQILNEEETSLIYGMEYRNSAHDSDEMLHFRALSFDDVNPQPLSVNSSDEENLIYSFLQKAEDMGTHIHVDTDALTYNLSPIELRDENFPIDRTSIGTLSRMNSMESLINGLMTWAPSDVNEASFPVHYIG